MDICKPHRIACACNRGRSNRGNMLGAPDAAALQPPDAAGPSAACKPSALPARSAQQAAGPPPHELPLEQVRQAQKLACTCCQAWKRQSSHGPCMHCRLEQNDMHDE